MQDQRVDKNHITGLWKLKAGRSTLELWPGGVLSIEVAGQVIVKHVEEWHALAAKKVKPK